MPFTPEELEALRRADEEIDAEFILSMQEIEQSRERDRRAKLEGLDNRQRRYAEYQRAYKEANREKIAENKRAYYEANRENIAEYHRAYYEANREKIAEYQRAYREANREKVNAYSRNYKAKRRALAAGN